MSDDNTYPEPDQAAAPKGFFVAEADARPRPKQPEPKKADGAYAWGTVPGGNRKKTPFGDGLKKGFLDDAPKAPDPPPGWDRWPDAPPDLEQSPKTKKDIAEAELADRLRNVNWDEPPAKTRAGTKLRGAFRVQFLCAQRGGALLDISATSWRISSPG